MVSIASTDMKWQAIIFLAVMAILATASAEDLPLPAPSPTPSASEMEEPALPATEAAPSNPEPDLLPQSGELPARPPSEPPLSPGGASAQEPLEKGGRFDEIRTVAMSDRRAVYLLKRARHSSNSASRHIYLRAYYVTVASRMRKLDPKLKSSIDAYEEAQIREIYGTHTATVRAPIHRSRVHATASRELHHRSHRVSYQHRYRRYIIIDYPYGPEFPPYGQPMVFYPW